MVKVACRENANKTQKVPVINFSGIARLTFQFCNCKYDKAQIQSKNDKLGQRHFLKLWQSMAVKILL